MLILQTDLDDVLRFRIPRPGGGEDLTFDVAFFEPKGRHKLRAAIIAPQAVRVERQKGGAKSLVDAEARARWRLEAAGAELERQPVSAAGASPIEADARSPSSG